MIKKKFLKSLLYKITYLFLAFCLFASAIAPISHGMFFYGLGFGMSLLYVCIPSKCNVTPFLLYALVCIFSSTLSFVVDYRIMLFISILALMTPFLTSKKAIIFRSKYLYYCLLCFPLLTTINLICFMLGINYYTILNNNVSIFDFSGIFSHPMWLGAANGLSNIVLCWLLIKMKSNTIRFFLLVLIILSVILSIVSASRSALAASCITICIMLYIHSKYLKRYILYIFFTVGIILTVSPYLGTTTTRIQAKMENQKLNGNSRQDLFKARKAEFLASPIWGVGFAVSYDGDKVNVGRMESGSGWLSILCQTGICGFLIIAYTITISFLRVRKYLRRDKYLLLFFSSFLYLCFHSCFEGYILTPGYYLCILFWGLLGYLYSYKKLKLIQLSTVTNPKMPTSRLSPNN